MPDICPHDSLRRSCPICERDEEIAELRKRVADAERERDKAREAAERSRDWWACRIERLKDFAGEKGVLREVCAIIANGTPDPHEPHLYAQRMELLRHKAERWQVCAEDLAKEVCGFALDAGRREEELRDALACWKHCGCEMHSHLAEKALVGTP